MTGQISLGAAEYSVGERDPFVTVTISRTGDLTGTASVTYATNVNTATENVDYTDTDGTASFAVGQSSLTVKIPIIDDNLSEATERFNFSVVSVDASSTILFPRTATISILDNENPVTDPVSPPLTSPYTVTTTTVLNNVNSPIAMEFYNDTTKAFLAEKGGTIKFVDMSSGAVLSTVLDISSKVNANADRGLLDIALNPDLAHNPYLYAFYVVDPAGTATGTGGAVRDGEGNRYAYLSRFTLNLSGATPTIVAGSEVVLAGGAGQSLADISGGGVLNYTDQTYANNLASNQNADGTYKTNYIKVDSQSHAGGAIAFGPDGMLYVSTGDGSSFDYADPRTANVQDVHSLNGKILRLDPITGAGLADNPYADGNLNDNQSKVWASGLRNPYTMTFADDGRLFMSETGWYSWEEINQGVKGGNYGWPFYEGGDNGSLLKTPAYQYQQAAIDFYAKVAAGTVTVTPAYRAFSHVDADPGFAFSAIVGTSTIYTGDKYPAAFQNDYFFTDIVDGEIYSVDINDRTKAQFVTDIGDYGPANFVQGPDGYMYLMDLVNGRILRLNITDPNAGQNHAPTVAVPIVDQSVISGTAFAFAVPAATFTDIDNNALTLSAKLSSGAALPSWLTFNATTGLFTGTSPTGTATVTVRVTATDTGALSVSDDFVINVGDGTTPETVVRDVAATNQNVTGATANDVFVFAGASTLYDWGPTNDGKGIVVWTRSATDNTYDILTGFEKLRFSDKTVTIGMTVSTGPDYADIADTVQQLTGTTSADRFIVNGPSTNYTWGATADGTGIVIWTNSTTDDTYDILKGFEQIVFTDRTVNLTTTNQAPVVQTPIVDQTGTVAAPFSFTLPANTFSDPDGDALTRTATLTSGAALPNWLVFNPTTGTFTGTPPTGTSGPISISVTANDGHAHTVTDTFLVTIGAGATNHAPTVANPALDQVATAAAAFSFVLPANVFTDSDGDALALTATLASGGALPSWLTFNATTRTFSGTPAAANVGALDVVVTAKDPGGLSVGDTFHLTVNSAPTNETLYQNTTANQIITATGANDVFVLGASSNGYQWGPTQDGQGTVVWNGSGYDILFGFEQLRFTNKSVNIATPANNTYQDEADVVQHLTGKSTNDIFAVNGPSTNYQWGATADGKGVVIWTTSTTDDTYDILTGFEKIQFTDHTVDISGLVT